LNIGYTQQRIWLRLQLANSGMSPGPLIDKLTINPERLETVLNLDELMELILEFWTTNRIWLRRTGSCIHRQEGTDADFQIVFRLIWIAHVPPLTQFCNQPISMSLQ